MHAYNRIMCYRLTVATLNQSHPYNIMNVHEHVAAGRPDAIFFLCMYLIIVIMVIITTAVYNLL